MLSALSIQALRGRTDTMNDINGALRREALNAEWFVLIDQARAVIGKWLKQYNHIRPHQARDMRLPVPEAISDVRT